MAHVCKKCGVEVHLTSEPVKDDHLVGKAVLVHAGPPDNAYDHDPDPDPEPINDTSPPS